MNLWSQRTLKSLVVPGGILFAIGAIVFQSGLVSVSAAVIQFYYYAVFGAGVLLAWRFHCSRVFFALITLLLAQRALDFFSAGRILSAGPGRIALEAVAFLLPVNFIVFSVVRERGLTLPVIAARLALLFFESVFVAVICRSGATTEIAFLNPRFLGHPWTHVPQLALFTFIIALLLLMARLLLYRRPVESGLLWSLAAWFLSLQTGGVGRTASAYVGTAGLILVSSIIENSYLLAYHDELTALPARRAFNEAQLRLEAPFAVAVVDIDRFKSFNDTYGHETGDQVLRMVASRLGRVTGGGQAYRVGGEEFSILFPGKSAKDVLPHLELLRSVIERSAFRVRGGEERRNFARTGGPDLDDRRKDARRNEDRRPAAGGKTPRPVRSRPPRVSRDLSVTVSIGVAEPSAKMWEVEQVIQAADKALYRAKQAGRNRVESATAPRTRSPRTAKPSVA